MKKYLYIFIALFLFCINSIVAQTTLAVGDIAIIGASYDTPDEFCFITFVDIEAGTTINFTENGWKDNGEFRTGEGDYNWVSSSNIARGSIVTLSSIPGFGLSSSGDQILVYQGTALSPNFIFAINSEGSGWQSTASDANTSALPSGLVNGTNAIAINEVDNFWYDGSITNGTKEELLSAICNVENWIGNNSSYSSPENLSFTVNVAGSDPQPLVTDFEASSIEVYVDENISFSNLSTGGIADFTFAWDFDGDNTVDSTEENPIYSYSSVGTYTVTLTVTDANLASDDEIKINYINVLEAPNVASDLFISEYIEGSSNNKVLEIFNGTGAPVALANYSIKISYNANPFTSEYNLSNVTTTLANNDVIVIANPSSNAQILALADATNSILGGNGDDAYGLFKNGSLIDIVGKESEDPGTAWPVAGVSNATADHTLIRKSSVYGPTTDWNLSAGSNSTDSQWIVNNQDDISDLGSHTFDGTGVEEGTVASPLITPESGEYINQVEVSITCETEGATIYYTIDGTDPTTASTQYNTAFTLTQSATVKAFAVKSGNTDSFISEAVFTISAPDPLVADFSADTISITVGSQVSFTDMTTGGIPEYLYSWDLDGDGEEDSTIANPSFTYNAVGTYTVELLVYDQELSESTERKVDYINVYPAASEPTIGTLFISEVSDATNYSNEYIELYNRGSQLLSLENITLRMDTNTNFALNNVSYVGDITIQPNGYMIITRGASRATFEAEFGLLGTGVSFLQGSGSMYFGSSPRRWQLVLITEAKAEIIIDDTIEAVGGSGNTSYQASPGTWVTDVFANNTPGAATDDQTLPVSFSSFMVNQTVDNFAQLEWVTQSEHEVAGYNIYRNTNDEVATAIQINDKMITAYNEATTRTYTFIDDEIEVNSSYYYWIESKDFDASSVLFGPVVIKISENDDSQDIVIPSKTLLKNVYPNPFNPSTRVNFYMDKADDVKIRVFNVRGQLISNLTEANYGEGFHNVLWDGKDLDGKDCASGIYFFRMETSEQNQMIKGILMK